MWPSVQVLQKNNPFVVNCCFYRTGDNLLLNLFGAILHRAPEKWSISFSPAFSEAVCIVLCWLKIHAKYLMNA
jgi:hypothetical protein